MAGRCAQHTAAVRAERVVLEFDALLGCVVALWRVPLVAAEAVERLQPPRATRKLLGVSNSLWVGGSIQPSLGRRWSYQRLGRILNEKER